MTDIDKWLQIVSKGLYENIDPGTTVQLSKKFGGGVGEFIQYTPGGTALVNVKGQKQDFPLEALENPIEEFTDPYEDNTEEQRYHEIDAGYHYLPDKPEMQSGDMVRIEGIYGSGVGEGFGVFVAYSTDGQSAVCNVDSEDRSFPIDLISIAPEEQQSDQFQDTGNDGSMSPMTLGGENRQEKNHEYMETEMDDLEKWMKIVNEEPEKQIERKTLSESACGCKQYDCDACFPPLTESIDLLQKDEIFDLVVDLNESEQYEDAYEKLDEGVLGMASIHDMTSNALVNDVGQPLNELGPVVGALARGVGGAVAKSVTDAALSKIGDKQQEIDELSGDNMDGEESPFTHTDGDIPNNPNYMDEEPPMAEPEPMGGEMGILDVGDDMGEPDMDAMSFDIPDGTMGDASADTSELVGKIAYMQDMGLSMSDRHYDIDRLNDMPENVLQRIYGIVMGEETNENTNYLMASESDDADLDDETIEEKVDDEDYEKGSDDADYDSDGDGYADTGDGKSKVKETCDTLVESLLGGMNNLDKMSVMYVSNGGDDMRLAELEESDKKADKDYDGDGKIESGEDEHYGSVGNAIEKSKDDDDDDKEDTKESVSESCDAEVRDALNKLFG